MLSPLHDPGTTPKYILARLDCASVKLRGLRPLFRSPGLAVAAVAPFRANSRGDFLLT